MQDRRATRAGASASWVWRVHRRRSGTGALKCCPNGVEALLRSGAVAGACANVDGTFLG